MSFTKWYEKTFGKEWEMDEMNPVTVIQLTIDYEMHCLSRGIEPSWDG